MIRRESCIDHLLDAVAKCENRLALLDAAQKEASRAAGDREILRRKLADCAQFLERLAPALRRIEGDGQLQRHEAVSLGRELHRIRNGIRRLLM